MNTTNTFFITDITFTLDAIIPFIIYVYYVKKIGPIYSWNEWEHEEKLEKILIFGCVSYLSGDW